MNRAFATLFALAVFMQVSHAQTLTCQQASQQLVSLDNSLITVSGCPHPIKHPGIPTVEPIGGNPPARPCTPNNSAETKWHKANYARVNQLVTQLSQCYARACPALPIFSPFSLGNDHDGDGIPDDLEQNLIERFSPFLRFSLDHVPPLPQVGIPEAYRPADPLWYISHSRLVGSSDNITVLPQATLASLPSKILDATSFGPSSILGSFSSNAAFTACIASTPRSPYHIDPVDDTAHAGADWPTVTQNKNVGLFAHVSKFQPRSEADLPEQPPVIAEPSVVGGMSTLDTKDLSKCARKITNSTNPVIPLSWYETHCVDCYKIEYYQFFGKNADHAFANLGDHEGDWSILTLVYEHTTDRVLAVSHWAHGYEMRFDLMQTGVLPQPVTDPIVGKEMQYTGVEAVEQNFNILTVSLTGSHQDQPELAQTNTLFMAQDSVTGEYSHPVAFVEFGSHEFWPTSRWGAEGAPAHPGDDAAHSYLTHNIPNLGEIEHPLGAEAAVLLGYNGSWGYINTDNNPPPGPALHKAWNWVAPNRTPISCSAAE
jgi:hypothetical protein